MNVGDVHVTEGEERYRKDSGDTNETNESYQGFLLGGGVI